jgi:succinoglycan biosynthesis protein ExoA
MQYPKPNPELNSETGQTRNDQDAGRRWAEPRSFAPLEGRARGRGEVVARWPQAWDAIAAHDMIRTTSQPAERLAAENRAVIVIPCLNEAKAIASVIDRILDDPGLVDPLLLVADGGSTDGTRDIVGEIAARDPRVRLVHNPARLQSAGINLAARLLDDRRPWMVRVDAHADYPPNYVSTLIAEARATGATSVVVSMDTKGEGLFQRATAAAQNSVLGTGGSAHRLAGEGKWVDHGHHALFRLDAFEAVGGYDETFSHNEDAELDLRLTREGGRIWLTDKVRIGYHPRSTPKALWKQYFSYGKGRARTVLKHFTPLKVRQALPLAVAPAVASLVGAPLFWPLAIPALTWMLATLAFGLLLAIKQRNPAIALSGPAAMIMHLSWSAGFWWQLATDRPKPEPLEIHPPLLRGAAVTP